MSCGLCEDGYIYEGDGARKCPACGRAEQLRRFGDRFYSPGGQHQEARTHYLATYNGRKGGLAAGIKRRQQARGRRRTRDGGLGVPHAQGEIPWLSTAELERLFRQNCEETGRRFHAGGFATVAGCYRRMRARLHCQGQGYEFTNGQVASALEAAGLPHSERNVRYVRARLEAMGVFRCAHVKRSGALCLPGRKDTVRVHFNRGARKRRHCSDPKTLPPAPLEQPVAASPLATGCCSGHTKLANPTDLSPPPSAADEDGARTGAEQQPGTEREELQRALDFQQLKLDVGWGGEAAAAEVRRLRQALRLLDGGDDP